MDYCTVDFSRSRPWEQAKDVLEIAAAAAAATVATVAGSKRRVDDVCVPTDEGATGR